MRRLIATLAVAATAGLGLSGCGDDTDPASNDSGLERSESNPAVRSVTMTRSGGIAGIEQTWRVGPSNAGHRAVFDAASEDALADADAGARGKPPCCDFFQYDLIVRYSDGSTATYRTWDGGSTDPSIDRLVDAVLKTTPRHADPSPNPR